MGKDVIVEHPTFLEHIKFMFEDIDIEHMRDEGFDLATYDGVREHAPQIYAQTKGGGMPPEKERRWSKERVATFRNWIVNEFPMGVARSPQATDMALAEAAAEGPPMRRNVRQLEPADVELLAEAFRVMKGRPTSDPNSYFALADIHWFPKPTNCLHNEERYNPWHRIYIDRFEAALRTVPGCENITLPYWDILQTPPDWLFEPPFDSYALPVQVAPGYPAGHKTSRFALSSILKSLKAYDVEGSIRAAMASPKFAGFNANIIQAHNDGHLSIGPTMENTDIASFDPIFWFFHCNWERMWWAWQRQRGAITLATFRKTLEPGPADWIDLPPFNELKPFTETPGATIDIARYAYEEDGSDLFPKVASVESGNIRADRAFNVPVRSDLSIRVKDIARLGIAGSFTIHLVADGKSVARHGFFQSTEPTECAKCVEREKVSIDFRVPRSLIAGKRLEIRAESVSEKRSERWIPLERLGKPTINVRELLAAE